MTQWCSRNHCRRWFGGRESHPHKEDWIFDPGQVGISVVCLISAGGLFLAPQSMELERYAFFGLAVIFTFPSVTFNHPRLCTLCSRVFSPVIDSLWCFLFLGSIHMDSTGNIQKEPSLCWTYTELFSCYYCLENTEWGPFAYCFHYIRSYKKSRGD